MKYVDFGYPASDKLTRDGELLATLGFTADQLYGKDYDESSTIIDEAFKKAGGDLGKHSGGSWSCARSVAAVLVKHGCKTVDEIPADDPLAERLKEQTS